MWTKKIPEKEGFYWVKAIGQLSGKIHIHPVHLYKPNSESPMTCFSDGDNFNATDSMFAEWWSEEIKLPAEEKPDSNVMVNENLGARTINAG